jgi:hypothetical protein
MDRAVIGFNRVKPLILGARCLKSEWERLVFTENLRRAWSLNMAQKHGAEGVHLPDSIILVRIAF